jgi:hypothetical protein
MNSDVSSGSAASPSDSPGADSPRALDEFAPERTFADAAASTPAGGVFSFACEPEREPRMSSSGSLLDIKAVAPPQPTSSPRPLSRREARQARRQERRLSRWRPLVEAAVAVRDWMRRTGDAIGSEVRETAHGARGRVLRRVSLRLASLRLPSADESRMIATPAGGAALDDREWTGFGVATLLAIAVVGYGSFLTTAWRAPAVPPGNTIAPATHAATPTTPATVAVAAVAIPGRVADTRGSAPAAAPESAPGVVRPAAFTPSPRTLTTMWQRRDTRSLERAFMALRQQTLALHRCGMRMTDTDRAVARCEGVATATGADGTTASRTATWTIDFRRKAGRWAIASVRMR